MKKKIFSLVLLVVLFGNPFSFTFAKSKVIYERSENLAKQYIENSLNDDNWKDKNPYISGEGKKFYTDDEKNPSYIEFKVSCDNEINCGFILVNSDGNDVVVPIASTSGIGPGELLSLQNEEKVNNKNKENKTNKKSNNKLYYFGPMDQYSIDEENDEVISINPQDEIDLVIENDKSLNKEDKDKEIKKKKSELKSRVYNYKIKAKEYKKSDEFKKHKEEIKDEILKMPKEEFVFEKLDMAFASYVNPGASDKFISGALTSNTTCNGLTPCYNQFDSGYSGKNCKVGCAPTAVGIIFGYHDRNNFPDLLSGTATLTNSYFVDTMIKNIGDIILTTCKGSEGSTITSNISKSKQYAIDKGYKNTTSTFISGNTSTLFSNIKTEINSGRPIIINIKNNFDTGGHSVVGFGYKSTGTTPIVRVNMGWGATSTFSGSSSYFTSSIDQNLNSVYYNSSNDRTATSIVTFKISK